MSSFIIMRDSIRNFLRKYDEITIPVLRFIASLIMLVSLNAMFGYSDLFNRGIVIFLLSVICALVSSQVAVIVAGAVVLVNAFTVSTEIGVLFLVGFILMYCMYMRMFRECAYIIALVPVLCMFKLYYAVPLIVVMVAGAGGAIPAGFGLVLYYFAECTRDAKNILATATEEDNFQEYSYIVEELFKNKNMLCGVVVFVFVILVTYTVYRLPIDYTWYISIAVGGVANIFLFLIIGASLGADVETGSLVLGTLVGMVVALCIQVCKSILDYAKKEVVQFEDDEYYYYVKAIPKFTTTTKKGVKKVTSGGASSAGRAAHQDEKAKLQNKTSAKLRQNGSQRTVSKPGER